MKISPALARGLRTIAQGLVAALGTVSLNKVFDGLDPQMLAVAQILLTGFVSHAQNWLEAEGKIKPLLLKK